MLGYARQSEQRRDGQHDDDKPDRLREGNGGDVSPGTLGLDGHDDHHPPGTAQQ